MWHESSLSLIHPSTSTLDEGVSRPAKRIQAGLSKETEELDVSISTTNRHTRYTLSSLLCCITSQDVLRSRLPRHSSFPTPEESAISSKKNGRENGKMSREGRKILRRSDAAGPSE